MYVPTNLHTHYSLLRSLIKPAPLVKKLADYGMPACCLTDFDVLSGSVKFYSECKEAGIKPILGTKIFISGNPSGYVTLLAQNLSGWRELLSLSSMSYTPSRNVERPTISLDELFRVRDCLVLVGTQESILYNAIFGENPSYTNPVVRNQDLPIITALKSHFGEKLFFQVEKSSGSVASNLAASVVESYAKLHGIKILAAPSPFYLDEYDRSDQLLLTATKLGCRVGHLDSKTQELEYTVYNQLINSNCALQSPQSFSAFYSESELKNTLLVADMCDDYTILGRPNLPRFDVPDGFTEESYLKQLCRDGWKNKVAGKIEDTQEKEYVDRVLHELEVICGASLSGYFLIVQDYVNWAKDKKWLVSPGRGSSAGSLISYLTNITEIDPIKHKLLFERFYNAGRNTKDKVSLPDIDCDFPVSKREEVINYIKNKYGHDNVCQVVTFARMSGRGALKEVLRATSACSNGEMDEITRNIVQESQISDKLEECGETSILRWVLNNEPKSVERWARINKDGQIEGDLSHSFAQAIRIEGTCKSYGKHASALIVSANSISDTMPMIREKTSDNLILGIEYEDAQNLGAAKMDILGLNTLDRLGDINMLLRYGKIL